MKTCLKLKIFSVSMLLVLAMLLATIPNASALTIVRDFISDGNLFPTIGVTAGSAPGNAAGGGNLVGVFDAAADWWEMAILDPHTVTIHFGWAALGGSTLGVHNFLVGADADGGGPLPFRETEATIRFDNDGSSVFFVDPTPHEDEEYTTFTETFADLGGGIINTGRVFTGPTGDAIGRTDLLTVAKHEVGHALGLSSGNISFITENGNGQIDVIGPRPFAGTVIPTISGAHLDIGNSFSGSLMFPSISSSIRKIQAGVDILANAEIQDFNNINLNPAHAVPEPSTILLFSISILAVFGYGWQRRKQLTG